MTAKAHPSELMYVQCAYCKEWIDVKPGGMNQITHTICQACAQKVSAALRKSRKAPPKPTRAGRSR